MIKKFLILAMLIASVLVSGANAQTLDASTYRIDWKVVNRFRLFRDPALFKRVALDPEVHTIVWPNGADFDPATLHDWPEHRDAFEASARQWAHASV